MAKITIPTSRNWLVSYFGDIFSNIVDTFNVDLHYSQGKVRTGQYLYPHTITSDISGIQKATAFVYTNADNDSGTLKYWAACEGLYKQANISSTAFVADTLTLSPTALVDSDLAKWGVTTGSTNSTLNGIDILVCSTDTDLALLNRLAAGGFDWIQNWWTSDLKDTIVSTNSSAPIQVTVADATLYNTGDKILISGSGQQYAQYSGNVVTVNASTYVSGLTLAETQTMSIGSVITGTNIPSNTLITSITAGTSITISNPATAGGTVSATWSDGVPRTLDTEWTVTYVSPTVISLQTSSGLNQFGNATNINFGGDITRTYNNNTDINFLGQTALESGVPHILIPFGNAPVLFITDGNAVHSIGSPGNDSNPTVSSDVQFNRLVFKPGYTCNWACATSLKVYFGLKNNLNDALPSLVEEYDPFNEQVREVVIQNGTTIGYLVDNNVEIIDYKGNMKSYNGTTFDVFSQFPTAEFDGDNLALPHRNGINVSENRINMLVPAGSYYNGGWWTYEIDTKRLYHQGSPVPSKSSQASFGSTSQDDYGAFFSVGLGTFLAGVSTYEESGGSDIYGIFVTPNFGIGGTPSYSPIGRITLGRIPSSEIDSVFRNVLIKYNPVLDRNGLQEGTIVLKYKIADYPYNGYNLSGTWVDATTFTVPSGEAFRVIPDAEVVVTAGQASGASFNVVSVTPSGSVDYVVVTDENIGFVPSGDFEFNIDNYIRTPSSMDITDNSENYGLIDLSNLTTNEWIELRIELRGYFSVEEVQVGVKQNLEVEMPG